MSDATNLPNHEIKAVDSSLSLESLTDQNWLFIKHFLETSDIRKAYELAGYEGREASAPYQVFKRLKPFIEEIGNMAVTSRLKLVADLNKALSLPLHPDKQNVSVSEWLRIRKLAISLTPDSQAAPKMSVLIVNRYEGKEKGQREVDVDNIHTLNIDPSNIINVTPE